MRASLIAFTAGLTLMASAHAAADARVDAVTIDTARAAVDRREAILIDIREPEETASGVAPGARLLPGRQAAARVSEIPTDPKQPVLLICNTQNRSRALLKTLRERGGYDHVQYVTGGMSEWARRGLPMVKP